jgi:hypothetical protein
MNVNSSQTTHKKIIYNYFNNIKFKDKDQFETEFNAEVKENSFIGNCRNKFRSNSKNLSSNVGEKNSKSNNRTFSIDMTNNSNNKSGQKAQERKKHISLNTNNNNTANHSFNYISNHTTTNQHNQKKVEDYLNTNFTKIDDSKIMKLSKSPIRNTAQQSNMVHYLKNSQYYKKINNTNKEKSNQTQGHSKSVNITTNLHSKYGSLNSSMYNNKIKSKFSPSHNDDHPTSTTTDQSRSKLEEIKSAIDYITKKNNKSLLQEVEEIINTTINTKVKHQDRSHMLERENYELKAKNEERGKQLQAALKENKELKLMISEKAKHFEKLSNEIDYIKQDFKVGPASTLKIHNKRASSPVKVLDRDKKQASQNPWQPQGHQNLLIAKNRDRSASKGKMSSQLQGQIQKTKYTTNYKKRDSDDLLKLDTIELMNRVKLDDPQSILYFPKKVHSLNQMNQMKEANVPKLDISVISKII